MHSKLPNNFPFFSNSFRLKEEVRSLQIILKEKNEDYKRLAAILKDQTEHWKKVTAKLMANRKTNTSSGNRKQIDEIESIEIEKQNVKSSISDDESTQLPQNKTIENQKFTDIQTQTQSPPKHQQEETQSHLDTLISLISGSSDTDLDHDESKENTSVQSAVSVPFDYQPRKRKSHSRGCPCCDKVKKKLINPDFLPCI